MPGEPTQLSPAEIRTCYRVCKAAAGLGITLRESHSQLGWQFSWQIPGNPRPVHGSLQSARETGLLNACKELMPHVSDHI